MNYRALEENSVALEIHQLLLFLQSLFLRTFTRDLNRNGLITSFLNKAFRSLLSQKRDKKSEILLVIQASFVILDQCQAKGFWKEFWQSTIVD